MALIVRSDLGLNPWGVLHEGLAQATAWSFGFTTMVVAAAVLLLWIPLKQRPGIGTVSNVVLIGAAADGTLSVLPAPGDVYVQGAFLLTGVALTGAASACYIGAGLGPGPRDGLMVGWVAQVGGSLRAVRTCLELSVLGTGWLLGGTVGVGTIVFAVAIGPLVQRILPFVTIPRPPEELV